MLATEKSSTTALHTRQPYDAANAINWPIARAGAVCISRMSRACAPSIGSTACAPAITTASASAKWPSSGIIRLPSSPAWYPRSPPGAEVPRQGSNGRTS